MTTTDTTTEGQSFVIRDSEINDGALAGQSNRFAAEVAQDDDGEVSLVLTEHTTLPTGFDLPPGTRADAERAHCITVFPHEFPALVEAIVAAGQAAGVFNWGTSLVEPPDEDDLPEPGHYAHEVLIARAITKYGDITGVAGAPTDLAVVVPEHCDVISVGGKMTVRLFARDVQADLVQVAAYKVVEHAPDLVPVDQAELPV